MTTSPIVWPPTAPGDPRHTGRLGHLSAVLSDLHHALDNLADCAPAWSEYEPDAGRFAWARVQHRIRQEHLLAVEQSLVAEIEGMEGRPSL